MRLGIHARINHTHHAHLCHCVQDKSNAKWYSHLSTERVDAVKDMEQVDVCACARSLSVWRVWVSIPRLAAAAWLEPTSLQIVLPPPHLPSNGLGAHRRGR